MTWLGMALGIAWLVALYLLMEERAASRRARWLDRWKGEGMNEMNGKHVICRCYYAGVHFGEFVEERDGRVFLRNARRVWYWENAATLSEVAEKGAGGASKIAVPVPSMLLLSQDVVEVLECAPAAVKWFGAVPPWRA